MMGAFSQSRTARQSLSGGSTNYCAGWRRVTTLTHRIVPFQTQPPTVSSTNRVLALPLRKKCCAKRSWLPFSNSKSKKFPFPDSRIGGGRMWVQLPPAWPDLLLNEGAKYFALAGT